MAWGRVAYVGVWKQGRRARTNHEHIVAIGAGIPALGLHLTETLVLRAQELGRVARLGGAVWIAEHEAEEVDCRLDDFGLELDAVEACGVRQGCGEQARDATAAEADQKEVRRAWTVCSAASEPAQAQEAHDLHQLEWLRHR